MATWREIALDAVREFGGQSAGDSLDTTEETFVLRRLKALLDSWAIKGYIFPGQGFKRQRVTITEGSDVYEVGTGKDIVISPAPMRLHGVNFRTVLSALPIPLVQVDMLTLESLRRSESLTSFYYELVSDDTSADNYGTSQYGKLHLNKAAETTNWMEVVYHNVLPTEATLSPTATAKIPVGYYRMVVYWLALEVAEAYGYKEEIYNRIHMKAQELMMDVMELNKGRYVAVLSNMRKYPVPGTDAPQRTETPVAGPVINRQMDQDSR